MFFPNKFMRLITKKLFAEFREATVRYSLESATVPLDEVFFPSVTLCNMNTLRSSFIHSLIEDVNLKAINVTFNELHRLIHLIFIAGEDYQVTPREKDIIESKFNCATLFSFKDLELDLNLQRFDLITTMSRLQ